MRSAVARAARGEAQHAVLRTLLFRCRDALMGIPNPTTIEEDLVAQLKRVAGCRSVPTRNLGR